MDIKTACRYSNFLNTKIGELMYLLGDREHYVLTSKLHRFSDATSNPDKTEEVPAKKILGIEGARIEDVAILIKNLILEKVNLSNLIEAAKYNQRLNFEFEGMAQLSIDAGIEFNKHIRVLNGQLQRINQFKTSEKEESCRGYTFNVEGNQVPYIYPIVSTTTENFDREALVTLEKQGNEFADIISNEIEKANLQDNIDFTPEYSVHDTCDQMLRQFMGKKIA